MHEDSDSSRSEAEKPKAPRRNGKAEPARARLLIFVIAYQAEDTLRTVLERIPDEIFRLLDCEILVVDDASKDRTFEIGCRYRDAHPHIPLTVLRNEYNQGYGGNQKVGYAFAIAHDFDFVAMVHGDGQYAPEELPKLVKPLVEDQADAVFGSRMMSRFGALRGGMPLYKFVGNKILTTAQNALLGTQLSEFHSGYRIYALRALKSIPFKLNSNDFHFDTEIIIQLLNAGMRIKELPIPTYYGSEISRVNGMKYAKDVMLATTRNALHRTGILYQRRFDTLESGHAHYGPKIGYASSHSYAVEHVPAGASVLHLGGDSGAVVGALVDKGCTVTLVERDPSPARALVENVHLQDLDDPPRYEVKESHILMLDVIEHLKTPEEFLEQLRKKFDFTQRTLVLTTPNIAFVIQRLMLALGQFNYGKRGILDRTHRRLFTFRSIRRLLDDSGFRIKEVRGVPAPFPLALGDNVLGRSALAANIALIKLSRTLFSYQILIVAETTPDLDYVLTQAQRSELPRSVPLPKAT
jgi:glycosyltransferase involved in cell wall biosynthesis